MSVQFAAARTSLGSIPFIPVPTRGGSRFGAPQSMNRQPAAAQPASGRPAAARSVSGRRPAPAGPLRLTRRGRLLLVGAPVLLGGAALLTCIGFFTAPALASNSSGELTRTQQVSVSTGDSLWSLATQYAPERDPRDVVADIMELNNLAEDTVPAGVQLYIPVAG